MKKIITLITMFVLSVTCLMAQGVFTYQAVVYNGDTLVVNQDVNAVVTITDAASNTYTEPEQTVHTSPNGIAVLAVGNDTDGNFKKMDWSTAKISVNFKVGSSTVMAATNEQIPAVPYALKAETKITTQMVRDYVQAAKINDVERIINAMSPELQEQVLKAIVDTVKDNYPLAKEIFISYLQAADANDAKQLIDSLLANPQYLRIMDSLASFLLDTLETNDGKALMLSLVENYVSNVKGAEVEKILGAMPEAVRDTIATRALSVLLGWQITEGEPGHMVLDPDIKDALKEIAKDYLWHVTFPEVEGMVNAVTGNTKAMDVLQPQFDKWMGQYVDSIVKAYMSDAYYYCESGNARNVCGTTTPCLSAPATFTLPTSDYDYYTATITYGGTTPGTVAPSSLELRYTPFGGSETVQQALALDYVSAVNADNQITVSIPASQVENFYDTVHQSGDASTQVAVMIVFSGLGCTPDYVQINIFF